MLEPSGTLRQRDEDRYYKARGAAVSRAEFLRHAVAESGRHPLSLALEVVRLMRGPGRLTLAEYVEWQVYRPDLTSAERAAFLSEGRHWHVAYGCADRGWESATEDKWLCGRLLAAAGIPSPQVVGIIDRTTRTWPSTRVIRSSADLLAAAAAELDSGHQIFAKINRGLAGWGAFVVDGVDDDRLHLAGEGWFTASHILDVLVGPETYLLQRAERCRPALADISGAVPTVRVNVFVTRTASRVDWPVLRLVAQGNPHSHSWLPSNLTCALDLDSGVILRALERQDPALVEHTVDPVTAAPIVGRAIEDWDALLDMAEEVGRVFAPVRYLSLDVGLTDRGPVVIEVNTGGGFGPWQRSSGRGVLDAQFRAFLTECGVTL